MNGQIALKRKVTSAGGDQIIETMDNQYSELQKVIDRVSFDVSHINKYELLDNCYRASGGFETGDYLIPHTSESIDKYYRRKKMSYFINYVKPIVDALVNPIFKTEPSRQGMSEMFSLFSKDVDGNNTPLTRFMKKAAIRAKLHGVEFIVVDMEELDSNTFVSSKDIIDKRLFPYLYLVSPSQVTGWATNKFGKLISITYTVQSNIVDSNGKVNSITENWTLTETVCKKSVGGQEKEFVNPIGMIPVIPLYGAINDSNNLIPQSDVFAIARTNFALYNACSELRERNRAQAFSLLTYPIADDDDYENGDEPIKYGTADMLLYRSSTGSEPKFITPPPDSSDILLNEIQFMIKEIYRMASLRMVTDTNQYNVSGLAKKLDNLQLYQSISELAQGLQEAEYKIGFIFNKFVGGDNDESFQVAYNNEYGILDTSEVLNNAIQSLNLGMTPEYNTEMRKQVAKATLDGINTTVLNSIVDGIAKNPESGNPLETDPSVVQPVKN